jgi:hypothetical protein
MQRKASSDSRKWAFLALIGMKIDLGTHGAAVLGVGQYNIDRVD